MTCFYDGQSAVQQRVCVSQSTTPQGKLGELQISDGGLKRAGRSERKRLVDAILNSVGTPF
jgi:hypothetical protein